MRSNELKCRPIKPIADPIHQTINISDVRTIVDSEPFQLTRYRLQLGEARVAYPSACHSRFTHMLGTMRIAERRGRRWYKSRMIEDEQDIRNLEVAGLLHDIGHGPLSHLTDSLVSDDHETRGLAIVATLRPEIEAAGGDYDNVMAILSRAHPLSQAIYHTPLGADKLDYLVRDAYFTGRGGAPDIGELLDYVYFVDDRLVADPRIRSSINALWTFYVTMYDQVYHRLSIVISERFKQRLISDMLGQNGDEPEFSESELVAMTDEDLNHYLRHSRIPRVWQEYRAYAVRQGHYPAICFQLNPYYKENYSGGHPLAHAEAPPEFFSSKPLRQPQTLYAIEREIEAATGLPERSVLVAPPSQRRRFEPQSIDYLINNSEIVSSATSDPELWQAQVKQADRYMKLYVATPEPLCPTLSAPNVVEMVREIIFRHI